MKILARALLVRILSSVASLAVGGLASDDRSLVVRLDASRGLPAKHGAFVEGFALLPPGAAPAGVTLCLESITGLALPTSAEARGVHRDGSARSLFLRAVVPAGLAGSTRQLRLGPGLSPSCVDAVEVQNTEASVIVATGGLLLEISKLGPDLLARFERDNVALKDPERPARVTARVAETVVSSEFAEKRAVMVVESGPLASRIVVAGTATSRATSALSETAPSLAYRIEFLVRAGVPIVDMRLEISSLGACRASDPSFEIPLQIASGARVRFLGADGRDFTLGRGESAEVLALDGQTIRGVRGKNELPFDPTGRCGLAVECGRVTFAAVASRLRPLPPRSLSVDAAGLRVNAQRGETWLADGEVLRMDLALGALRRDEASRGLVALRAEPLPSLSRVDLSAFDGAGFSPIPVSDHDPNDPAPRLLAAIDSAVQSVTGWRDYGDYRLGRGFANLEYDPALAFQLRTLGGGDARHIQVARDMLRHFAGHDVSRGELGSPEGVPWMHGDDHRSFEFEPGHVFAGGIVLAALVDDDPSVGRAASRVAMAVVELVTRSDGFDHERDFGWGLVALSDAALLLGDDAVRGAREALMKRLIEKQAPRGFFAIDRRDPREEGVGAYCPCPWVTGGITLEGIFRTTLHAPSEEATRLVRVALDFLLVDARYENGEFASKVAYAPDGELALAQEGVASPIDRLMIAAGIGRAGLVLGDTGLLTRFDSEVVAASSAFKSWPLSANDAARALVAWRSIVDTRTRSSSVAASPGR